MRILDTDTCIGLLRRRPPLLEKRAAVKDRVATTWITASELFYGAGKAHDPIAAAVDVNVFLDSIRVLLPDRESARRFGEVKCVLERRGTPLADADVFIASIVLARGAILVTGNRRHFERIAGIAIEDWLRP